ncbi:hypothetical protein ACH5RR_036560 [Cinchona calisaya]|uniref:Uncharacterized protein n=1 Tax=Cinchona calisaya TaxID=153742 RepID=A0ABD2Y500_9GENT
MNLNVQHTEFNDFHRRSQIIRKKGGVFGELMPKDEDFSRALYTFDIGQNDLNGGHFVNMTTDQIKAIVPELIDQLTAPIKDIYDQGGRSFWIHNTGPFGCSPAALETFLITGGQIDEVECTIPYNEVAQLFNSKLKEAVVQLRKELPEAALTYVDVYTIKYDLISHAKKHGFQQPLTSCCGYGGKYKYSPYYGCGRKVTLHDIKVTVGSCKDPSVMLNWDGIHYTQAANKWIAERIISGLYSDPPIPLKMACHKELDINLVTPY